MSNIHADKVRAKTAEIEGLFRHVAVSPPAAYVEVPIGLAELKVPAHCEVVEPTEENTKRVYFAVVSSYGLFQAGHPCPPQDRHFESPADAVTAWSHYMDQFLAESPGRERLYWRVRPALEMERDFERSLKIWTVYSRIGIM